MNAVAQASENLKRYALNSRHYLENALVFLERGEAGKAGELLWGSVAEALHAVAVSRNIRITTHGRLRDFARTIAKERDDASLLEGLQHAEHLHSNFYEVDLEPQDIAALLEPIRTTVAKLLALIPPEALWEKPQEVHNP